MSPAESGAQLQRAGKACLHLRYLESTLALRGEAMECICISVGIFSLLLLMLPCTFPEIGNDMSCEKHLNFITLLIMLMAVSSHPAVAK